MFNYNTNPWLWAFVNFDGEHYLSLAQVGYQPLTYFYFPAYPMVIQFIGSLFGGGFTTLAVSGVVVSNVAFFIALLGLWKLLEPEFGKRIARHSILLLLFFPTSYYFGSLYTESLFLALIVWSFYFANKNNWIMAGILGGISSATRIIGAVLAPAFLFEIVKNRKKRLISILGAALCMSGLFIYMYYLKVQTGDPLNFLNTVSIFGAQRSSNFILLPQVFYRYFFRVMPYINYAYLPGVFTFLLELVTAIVFLGLSVFSFWKLKRSYALFLTLGYLIPTLSGSFSSLPRYVLVLFPGFVLMAIYLAKLPKTFKIAAFTLLFVSLGIATCLFVRGYWIS